MEPQSTLEKVKIAYEISSLLDNEDLRNNFNTLKGGEVAYRVFRDAIEQEVERLMAPEKVIQHIDVASKEINEIVSSIKQLQESLVVLVQRAINPGQQQQQQVVRLGRYRNSPLPSDEDDLSAIIPGDAGPDIVF